MGSGYYFRLLPTEEMCAFLDTLPLGRRRTVFEHAINRALDDVGWPRGERGEMPIPASYWYVVVMKGNSLRGHVGPISDETKARIAARSWSIAGHIAHLKRYPLGPCLTNPHHEDLR
jgi:hypothetical protein